MSGDSDKIIHAVFDLLLRDKTFEERTETLERLKETVKDMSNAPSTDKDMGQDLGQDSGQDFGQDIG